MKRKLIIITVSSLLLVLGCAKKEVKARGLIDGKRVNSQPIAVGIDDSINSGYENVDPYNRDGGSYNYNNRNYSENSYGERGGIKNIYFASDQYAISSDKLYIVRNNARILSSSVKDGNRVKIEGHCDATGTDEYNYALGLRRAKSAKDAIVSSGLKASTITVVSMGESSPECTTGYTSACYAKNRRVEFKVIR
jgi:peptidoglycan-associated lipoprotein